MKRERENDQELMYLAPRKTNALVVSSHALVATAKAIVENPKRLEHFVSNMPASHLKSLVQGTHDVTPMTMMLYESNLFWYFALKRCAFKKWCNYKHMVRESISQVDDPIY
ncbi:MAG: hypothetical protein K2Q45_01545 [Nitrosomonas sp.]|nr:hypothetical protein [Nitrosomonas sp.]